jgi:hypothetical protein
MAAARDRGDECAALDRLVVLPQPKINRSHEWIPHLHLHPFRPPIEHEFASNQRILRPPAPLTRHGCLRVGGRYEARGPWGSPAVPGGRNSPWLARLACGQRISPAAGEAHARLARLACGQRGSRAADAPCKGTKSRRRRDAPGKGGGGRAAGKEQSLALGQWRRSRSVAGGKDGEKK